MFKRICVLAVLLLSTLQANSYELILPTQKNSITNSIIPKKKELMESDSRFPTLILEDKSFSQYNNNRLHPNQKAVPLLEYLIKTYTEEGMTVLDNCMGSGSTMVACINTNRNGIGIELDNDYFNISKTRIEEAKNDLQ